MSGAIAALLAAGGLGAVSASVDLSSVTAHRGSPGVCNTVGVTASGSGGTAPYSYSWVWVSGDSAISANSPSSATTSFAATVSTGDNFRASFRCTVMDAVGATATVNVSVNIYCTGGLN